MRYLNKIIFVNSANIAYSEISVDGTVHFTGTQGVGKSTVLRALLFFYNADKQKLGIQQGQKPFDEFYFKQSNSYILYEVMREHGAYTILVSRYQGSASFRFIDAPYDRSWLIDEHRQVMSDWIRIRERIDRSINYSARIASGSMYRDIIFGNASDRRYAKYAIVESRRYQNIPRSIQNVFLNSKLDADFVKNTIIQSMAEDEVPLDLTSYRRQVSDFEREYIEIDCWYQKDKAGEYPVRRQAQRIAEKGRMLLALDQQMLDLWHDLNYAVAQSEEKLPILQAELERVIEQQHREETNLREQKEEYDKERDKINQGIGGCKQKLNEIKEKRNYFDSISINDKLELASTEPSQKQELAEKQNLLNDLMRTHETIGEKYKILREKLKNDQRAFELVQMEQLNLKRNEVQLRRDNEEQAVARNRKKLTEAFEARRKESDARLQELQADQHRCDIALRELRTWHPKQAELDELMAEMQKLQIDEKEKTAQLEAAQSRLQMVQQEGSLKEREMNADYQQRIDELVQQIEQTRERIAEIDEVLSHLEGSLYHWLTQHAEGWEETIGRVVDERRVLYAQDLQPELVEGDRDSLFGVRLNLDAVEPTHRTPDEYRTMLDEERKKLLELQRQMQNLEAEREQAVRKLQKKYADLLNPIRQQITMLKIQLEQIPTRRQDQQNRLHSLRLAEEEIINKEQEVRQRNYNEALLKVKQEHDERDARLAKYRKETNELDSSVRNLVKELKGILDAFKEAQRLELDIRKEESRQQMAEINRQEKAELEGRGVDFTLLDNYRKAIAEIEGLLKRIEEDRETVMAYRIAERDLFALEPSIRKDKKLLESRLEQLSQRYNDKRQVMLQRLEKQKALAQEKREEIGLRKEGLKQYHAMIDHEHLVPDDFMSDVEQNATKKPCQDLIAELRGVVNQKHETFDSMKGIVAAFNRNFKPQNAFGFNTAPVSDHDYLAIAMGLQEFIDNNKIEEYRSRTSEHYKDILQRISVEVGGLMKRRSDVDGIIQEINRDFVEKNFVGVIRSIALRSEESSDRLMRLLASIQSYTEEHALSMGELNLFSGDDRDEVNLRVVDYLKKLTHQLQDEPSRTQLTLCDTFRLQFRVQENDNDTNWTERINNVGSDGTDILVKAMVNIMLINVFKKKAARKNGDFIVHCMMDEIGRLHPNNIRGILQFATSRNIYLINSSPTSYNAYDYKYTYMLSKQANYKTRIERLLKRN